MGSVRGGATTSIAAGAIVGLDKWKIRGWIERIFREMVILDRILIYRLGTKL